MKSKIRNICVVTGTRAEYGLLRNVMQGIKDSQVLDLQLVVTGMHLSPEFGLTIRDIENDGFTVDRKVEMLLSSDTPVGIAKSTGLGMIGFADVFYELRPDLILVLGDRYEIFAASAAAMMSRTPIAHCHGGELSEGAIDEAIRHGITKMSHFHFVAAEEYRLRVIQLGECPKNVVNVGGLGVDNIQSLQLLEREQLEQELGFEFMSKNLLITFHPVTLEACTSEIQMKELLRALDTLDDTRLIFTMPNSDADSRILFELINTFCKSRAHALSFTSLGSLRYMSCLQFVDAVVGNSSSGLLEVPSFGKGTINIGDRQTGRIKSESVIDCQPTYASILSAIEKLYTDSFQSRLHTTTNPYGTGGASQRIVHFLACQSFEGILKKSFFDIKHEELVPYTSAAILNENKTVL